MYYNYYYWTNARQDFDQTPRYPSVLPDTMSVRATTGNLLNALK